jgi:large subunit ribosomal protein L17
MRNLSTALFDKEKITTTLAKAKELRPFAEKLLTISKQESLHARRRILRHIKDKKVVGKMIETLSARYAQRPGGYTRIIKLGPRRGDHAEMAIIELVGAEGDGGAAAKSKKGKSGKAKKTTAKKTAARKTTKKKAVKASKADEAPEEPKKTKKKASKAKRKAKSEAADETKKAARPKTSKKAKATKKTKAKSRTGSEK